MLYICKWIRNDKYKKKSSQYQPFLWWWLFCLPLIYVYCISPGKLYIHLYKVHDPLRLTPKAIKAINIIVKLSHACSDKTIDNKIITIQIPSVLSNIWSKQDMNEKQISAFSLVLNQD